MNKPTFTSIETIIGSGLDVIVMNQVPLVTLSFTDFQVLAGLKREAVSARVNFASKSHGELAGWRNVYRATFFPEVDRSSTLNRLASTVLRSERFIPRIHAIAKQIEATVQKSGEFFGILEFSEWQVNRIGVNILNGRQDESAYIARHTDVVAESGLVVALELGYGENMMQVGTHNNIQIIPGADVCSVLGMKQAEHGGVEAFDTRYSLTFAYLKNI